MTKKWVKRILILFIIIAIPSIYFICTSNQEAVVKARTGQNKPKVVIKEKKSEKLPLLRFKFKQGDYFTYKIKYNTNIKIVGKKSENISRIKISGKLHQKIYENKNDNIFVGYMVEVSSITMDPPNSELLKKFGKSLEQEIFITQNSRGLITKWLFPKSIPPYLRNNMKSLLLNMQIVFPKEKKSNWKINEINQNGEYIARYKFARIAGSKLAMLFKAKQKYLQKDREEKPRILTSRATIKLDPQEGYVKNFHLIEEISYKKGYVNWYGKFIITAGLLNKTVLKDLDKSKSEKLKKESYYATTSSKIEGQEKYRENRLKRILNNKTWKDLQKDFVELMKKNMPRKRYEFYRQIAAWMELNPQKMDLVTNMLIKIKNLSPAVSTIISALSDVQHPKAQEVLKTVIEKHQDNYDIAAMAISCLGLVQKPSRETIRLFQNLKETSLNEQVKNTAILALGNVIGVIRKKDSSRAAALVYDIEKSLQASSTFKEKKVLLSALGNAGSSSSLEFIEPYLKDKNNEIQKRAISALRYIDDPKVDILLTDELKKSTSLHMQNNILETMGYRAPNKITFDTLSNRIVNEKSERLKIKEAKMLWQMRKKFPQASSIVKHYAQNDQSEKVRQSLKAIMLVDHQ